jgi:hypothetical protein
MSEVKKTREKPVKKIPDLKAFCKAHEEELETLFRNPVLIDIILIGKKDIENLKFQLTQYPKKRSEIAYLQGQIKGLNRVFETLAEYETKMKELRAE